MYHSLLEKKICLLDTRIRCLQFGFDLISHEVLEQKMFKNNGHIHVYGPIAEADNPLESKDIFSLQ